MDSDTLLMGPDVASAPPPAGGSYMYPQEPELYWSPEAFDRVLLWASAQEASDIVFSSNIKPRMRRHGRWVTIGRQPIRTGTSLIPLLLHMTKAPDALSRIRNKEYMDFVHEVKSPEVWHQRIRFRVNVTAATDRESSEMGMSFVLRTIPDIPKSIDTMNVEPKLLEALYPDNGLVLVTGVMGSGKSTLLAGAINKIVATQPRHVVTFEHPIEFDLMGLNDVTDSGGFVVQSQIGLHLKRWEDAAVNSTRRACDVAFYGEIRDEITAASAMEQAEVGTAVYATLHTKGVSETPARIINRFVDAERNAITATFWSSVRLLVQQRLLPRVDGGRCAIREWLAFTVDMQRELSMADPIHYSAMMEAMMADPAVNGRTLLYSAERLLADCMISEETFDLILGEKRGGR